MLDILIKGGRIYDGTGNPWYRADVAVKAGRIAAIGTVTEKARRRISAAGLAVCPGFVDVHTHAEGIAQHPAAQNILRQGVTTVVAGNCGGGALPVKEALAKVEAARPAINYATLVGHGSIRRKVMGMARRAPSRRELAAMRRLVARAMREGAVGMSTGLFYVPGAYARVAEIIELAKVVAAWGGVYTSHTRSAGGQVFAAIREAATVGRKAAIPVQISHLKVMHRRGRTRSSRSREVEAAIARYRRDGIDVTYDVYPYTATNTSLSAVALPPWVARDGDVAKRLQDAAIRRKIRRAAAERIAWTGGWSGATIASFPPDESLEGKSLLQVARARKRDPVTTAMDLIAEGAPSCIFHCLRSADVSRFVCGEHGMIASDGAVVASRGGVVHPRNYGTFPRVLRQFVRERRLMTLEQAVRKMTSLPARRFTLPGRGILAVGMAADIVVFDPQRISDGATFEAPHAYPVGLKAVLVNGRLAWDGRAVSRRRWGLVIRRK